MVSRYTHLIIIHQDPNRADVDRSQIPGKEWFKQTSPFDHQRVLAEAQGADAAIVEKAITGALAAKNKWIRTPLHQRAAIFYRAAWLLQNQYKYQMMAATMLGQGKNPYQADIDCIAEVSC